ncbi:MAG: CmcJ/NvfI family oxidoreductase [Pseudomonadota bacterium]
MADALARNFDSPVVEATLNYMVDTGAKPVTRIARPGERPTRRQGLFEAHKVAIRDGRAEAGDFGLDREGFVLTHHASKVSDFYDEDEVRDIYYPETERLVQDFTGAAKVFVFDHTLRADSEATQAEKQVREPVQVVHNDYTDRSAPQRIRDLLPADEAEARLKDRFAVVQVWRPIGAPVERMPLAICDAQSIAAEDFKPTELRYEHRVGEVLQLAYNPDHRWFYIPKMTKDEALVFKCYDSLTDGRARFTAHSAFDDPRTPPEAPERESIEMRTLVFY